MRTRPLDRRRGMTMAKLIYLSNISVDGFIEDEDGQFGWTEPDDKVFKFITELMRPVGNYLYGRRIYETMAFWAPDHPFAHYTELAPDLAACLEAGDKC